MSEKISSLILPGLFILGWVLALMGLQAPGVVDRGYSDTNTLHWLLYFAGWVFIFSSIMHSVFSKSMAKSIGWKTNGFQYEIAAVSLGLGLGCFYAVEKGQQAWVAISLPIITFLAIAGINHLIEIFKRKNYAPNNTMILLWDFGMPLSLIYLLYQITR
ncbi:MAG: DUF6790 family protein [Candidatus Saccharibacteria bacterium]